MVTSLKPEVTAQLARIAATVGPWAALNGAGTPADLARLPPVINEQVGFIKHMSVCPGHEINLCTGLMIFVAAVAGLVCPDRLGWCLSRPANIYFGPSITNCS